MNMESPEKDSITSNTMAFSNADQQHWWETTGPILIKMLSSAGYSLPKQKESLAFYSETLIPLLGPYPQRFRSAITRSGLPVEFSANYQQVGSSHPIIRIGFEPLSMKAGTDKDPYNQLPHADLLGRLTDLDIPGFNAFLFDHFRTMHTLNPEERDRLRKASLEAGDINRSQMAFGFDFKDNGISVKGYTFPTLKCKATGKDFSTIIRESIELLSIQMGNNIAFEEVDSYMLESDGYTQFAFFSWDCVSPNESRLKLYSTSNSVVWSKVEEIWTLGGRISSPTINKGLEYLRKLWELTGINEGYRSFVGGFDDGSDISPTPIVWNYEMRASDLTPVTKFYFPIHGENDGRVVRGLSRFLEQIGLVEQGRKYKQTVQEF